MRKNIENYYFTKSLYEAGYLYASGLTLLGLERNNKIFFFVFQEKVKAEKLRDLYWAKAGTVRPKLYAMALKDLKERIFANPSQSSNTSPHISKSNKGLER